MMVSSEILQVAVWQVSRGAWPGYVSTQMPVGGGTVSARCTSACAPQQQLTMQDKLDLALEALQRNVSLQS